MALVNSNLGFLGGEKRRVPNWKEGKGGESRWSQRFLPLRWAEIMVLPKRAASKSEAETESMTLVSLAIMAFFIFLPRQCSSTARLAASTSGSSGIFSLWLYFYGLVCDCDGVLAFRALFFGALEWEWRLMENGICVDIVAFFFLFLFLKLQLNTKWFG